MYFTYDSPRFVEVFYFCLRGLRMRVYPSVFLPVPSVLSVLFVSVLPNRMLF